MSGSSKLISNLVGLMSERKMNAEQLSHESGVHLSIVYRTLRGETFPREKTIESLAAALGTDTPTLMYRVQKPKKARKTSLVVKKRTEPRRESKLSAMKVMARACGYTVTVLPIGLLLTNGKEETQE